MATISEKTQLITISTQQFTLGCDPELFATKRKRVVGSEKLLKGGIAAPNGSRIIEDGVQVELNPSPSVCREALCNRIKECFQTLETTTKGAGLKLSSEVLVSVSKREFNSLSDKNKQFGCNESFSAYKEDANVVSVDPSKYLIRGAGGHIHLGVHNASPTQAKAIQDPKRTVPILDILVGNTLVMIDRSEGNIERRKTYGQAGEYRTPNHGGEIGLEYRTPSNFWLLSRPLASLALGLARHAVGVVALNQEKELLKLVDINDIIKAINTNDYELAKANWDKYKYFLVETAPKYSNYSPINSKETIINFEYFAKQGYKKWFSDDYIKNWTTGPQNGWATFQPLIEGVRRIQLVASQKEAKV